MVKVTGIFVVILTLAISIAEGSGFVPLPVMRSKRNDHTLTLLDNGNVLVAGGSRRGPTAEIYDVSTNEFRLAGEMVANRSQHTATLLRDGTVLIAGGTLKSAEIYDPTTNTFTVVGALVIRRRLHTATLLPDGTVLITGGRNTETIHPQPILRSAEIYDPKTQTFRLVGEMQTRRAAHSATLLSEGTVLIAGGFTGDEIPTRTEKTVERYSPKSFGFSAASDLMFAREGHTAIRLPEGNVLFLGGDLERSWEIYRPDGGSVRTGSLRVKKPHEAVLLPDRTVLILNSADTIFDPPAQPTILDLETMSWHLGPPLHFSTEGTISIPPKMILLRSGNVLVAGGRLMFRHGFPDLNEARLFVSAKPLVLSGGRHSIHLVGLNPDTGAMSDATAVKLNEKSGFFYFPRFTNDADNPEVFLKIVGPMPDGAFLFFYGSLTHVEFWLSVTDTATRRSRIYSKPPGGFNATLARAEVALPFCQNCLMLQDSKLTLTAVAVRGESRPFSAIPVPFSEQFGFFAFPEITADPENPEVIIKAVGPLPTGEYLLFVAGLTDAEVTLTVRSAVNGSIHEQLLVKAASDFHADVLWP